MTATWSFSFSSDGGSVEIIDSKVETAGQTANGPELIKFSVKAQFGQGPVQAVTAAVKRPR